MIKKLFETIYGRDYELRERIFRMLILVGICLARSEERRVGKECRL